MKVINYNGTRVIYDNSTVEHFDFIDGEEIATFTFYKEGKQVLKFQETV